MIEQCIRAITWQYWYWYQCQYLQYWYRYVQWYQNQYGRYSNCWKIFQRASKGAQLINLAFYAYTINIFSITWSQWSKEWSYQWRLTLVLLMILLWWPQINFIPPDVFTSKALVWIKEQKTFIQARVVWEIRHGYIMMFCTDAAFCYICMKAQWEKYKASTKHQQASLYL